MSNYDYNVAVLGGGPGGYVAAIRLAQLGKKVAIVEENSLGGICLNWGCIPTKSLLTNAHVLDIVKNAKKFGINIPSYEVDWSKVIKRSRDVSKRLSKGIEYLMKKNKITYIPLRGVLENSHTIALSDKKKITANSIVIATGASPKKIPIFKVDAKNIITSSGIKPPNFLKFNEGIWTSTSPNFIFCAIILSYFNLIYVVEGG